MKQRREIHFVVDAVSGTARKGFTSEVASNRYRVILPAQALGELGCVTRLFDVNSWSMEESEAAAVVVIGKLMPRTDGHGFHERAQKLLAQVKRAQAAGVPVVGDFNDVHFESPVLGSYWRQLAAMVQMCLAGSEKMAELLGRYSNAPIHVIGDPIASPFGVPKPSFRPPTQLRSFLGRHYALLAPPKLQLVWFGHPVNWGAMVEWAEKLVPLSREIPFVLWISTTPDKQIQTDVDRLSRAYAPHAKIHLIPWTLESQWEIVRDSDIVLIPSKPGALEKDVKTSNRLTDALHMGRHVVASPLSAYLPFGEYVELTDDPVEGIRRILGDPVSMRDRLLRGQAYVQALFSPLAIGRQWLQALERVSGLQSDRFVSADETPPSPVAETPLIRLNLGCGDKILPGYVNVDVVASRAGKVPDVLCDLHDLAVFPDHHADEVMAIHVVEHFWRWEVEAVLKEWVRVLKPGGTMVLECPNLISACEEFLRNPDLHSHEDQRGQRTMWVFYGDPAWKDPYMIHRWGYTPGSLIKLMESVGLTNVRQEPAQYKLREPRDMRVIGTKAFN